MIRVSTRKTRDEMRIAAMKNPPAVAAGAFKSCRGTRLRGLLAVIVRRVRFGVFDRAFGGGFVEEVIVFGGGRVQFRLVAASCAAASSAAALSRCALRYFAAARFSARALAASVRWINASRSTQLQTQLHRIRRLSVDDVRMGAGADRVDRVLD